MGDDVADSDSYIMFEPEDTQECIGLMQHYQDFSVPLSGSQTIRDNYVPGIQCTVPVKQIASDSESVLSIDNEPSMYSNVS